MQAALGMHIFSSGHVLFICTRFSAKSLSLGTLPVWLELLSQVIAGYVFSLLLILFHFLEDASLALH